MDAALARALALVRRNLELVADSVRALGDGLLVLTPSLPSVWGLNHLRLPGSVPLTRLQALAHAHLDGLPYLYVVIEHDEAARRLEPELRSVGWKAERSLLMALDPRTPHARLATDVIEPTESETLDLMLRWAREEHNPSSEELDQLVEASRREGRAWSEHRFGLVGEDGRLAAIAKLRSDGATGQIEDVYTAPESRGRGFATTLVAHAAAVALAADHDLVFIVADDDDWPKELYARLGFEPVGRTWEFHRGR